MSNKHRGHKHIIIRAEGSIHDKIGRVMAATGADKSSIVRATINWMSEEQMAAILAQRGQQSAVRHAP